MVRRATAPAVAGIAVAAAAGALAGGADVGASAAIGVAIVVVNFAAHGVSIAWASTISIPVVFAVALGGFVVRMGVVVTAMFALSALAWFSPVAFGVAVVPSTLLLLAFEARLASRGVGASLEVPPDPVAAGSRSAYATRGAR